MPRRNILSRVRRTAIEHALFEPLEPRQMLAIIAWSGAGDGVTLTQAANWAGAVLPGASDNAVINIAGTPTIALSGGAFSVNSFSCAEAFSMTGGTLTVAAASDVSGAFTMTGGTLTGLGDVAVSGAMIWSGGTLSGAGAMTFGAASVVTLSGGTHGFDRNITNSGTVNWSGGQLGGSGGAGITFINNGTFNAGPSASSLFSGNGGSSTFVNGGVFNKSGGMIVDFFNCLFNSTGSVNVNGGTLELSTSGSMSSAMTVASGATLLHDGGTFHYSSGATFAGAGAWSFAGGSDTFDASFQPGGPVTISAGTLSLNAAAQTIAVLTQTGGTIIGAGNLTVSGALVWSGGTMSGTGSLTIGASSTATLNGSLDFNRNITNAGVVNWTGGDLAGLGGAAITFTNIGTFNAGPSGNSHFSGNNTANTFVNAGTFNKTGLATVDFNNCIFNSAGTLNVFGGVLDIDGGGTNTGARNTAAGATLSYRASYTHGAGSTANGSGFMLFNGGTQTISGDWTAHTFLQILQGIVTGAGNLTTTGPITWGAGTLTGAGGITIAASGKLALTTTGSHILSRTITNNGQLHFLNGQLTLAGVTINNNAAGTLAVLATATVSVSAGINTINNAGLFKKMGGGVLTLDSALGGVRMNNTGVVDVRNGTLNLNGPLTQVSGNALSAGTWQVYPTGTLGMGASVIRTVSAGVAINMVGGNAGFSALSALTTNNGALSFSLGGVFQITPFQGTFTNNGIISLTQDRWLQINGNFVQGSAGSANLSMLTSARYSRIIATGSDTLGGSVSFNLVNSFIPAAGTVFDFMQGASRAGTFATATVPSIPGRVGVVTYTSGGARLGIS